MTRGRAIYSSVALHLLPSTSQPPPLLVLLKMRSNLKSHFLHLVAPLLRALKMSSTTPTGQAATLDNLMDPAIHTGENIATYVMFIRCVFESVSELETVGNVKMMRIYKERSSAQHEYLIADVDWRGTTKYVVLQRAGRLTAQERTKLGKHRDSTTSSTSSLSLSSAAVSPCASLDSLSSSLHRDAKDTITIHTEMVDTADHLLVAECTITENCIPIYWWELVVLARAISKGSIWYTPNAANCYFYSGMIMAVAGHRAGAQVNWNKDLAGTFFRVALFIPPTGVNLEKASAAFRQEVTNFTEACQKIRDGKLADMAKLKTEGKQKDEALAQKDEALAQKDEALAQKDEALAEMVAKIAAYEASGSSKVAGRE
ncbi:hypothetical protein B0H34DRAFT_686591 [Crassisporium funariophilum]|nr:hypothetical protein B0H34DRAFT_686591 [Crassisporium funariophilum]